MTRISIELVPRTAAQLDTELRDVCLNFPHVDTVNIPDLLRFKVRSWQGCAAARQYVPHAIPHIRAIDFERDRPWPLLSYIDEHDLQELLIVNGDPPPAEDGRVPDTSGRYDTVGLLAHLKQARPHLRLYAAIDPYRSGIQQEIEYAQRKTEAGADGFFTQPFFDVRLMEIFREQLPAEMALYWGVSPVLTAGSKNYWTSRNRAVFPSDFEPTLAWNQAFGRRALRFAEHSGDNIYFMPIRADLVEYLGGILFAERAAVPA